MSDLNDKAEVKPKRFLSLRWKALLLLTAIFSLMNVGYVYLTYLHLDEQFEHQLNTETIRSTDQFSNELNSASLQLQQLAEGMLFSTDNQSDPSKGLIEHINQKWGRMESDWGLKSAALYDLNGVLVSKWGKTYTDDGEKAIALRAFAEGRPQNSISCDKQCYLVNSIPLSNSVNNQHILVIKTSLSEIIDYFASRNDIGVILIQQGRSAYDQRYLKDWHHSIIAMTEAQRYLPILALGSHSVSLENLIHDGNFYFEDMQSAFNLQLVSVSDVLSAEHAMFILIKDVSSDREVIISSLIESIIISTFWSIVAEIFMISIMWHSLKRINRQAEVLPLLALGDYRFRNYRSSNKVPLLSHRDELNVLEETSAALSQQLYEMSVAINEREKELRQLALYDTLTGLANRRLFVTKLEEAIEDYKRHQRPFALLFFDLDYFKRINDSLGHDSGDELLKTISERLLQVTRTTDTVARLGGDEFTVLLTDVEGPKAVLHGATKILEAIRRPIHVAGTDVLVTSSIGIAMAPENGLDAHLLMKNADLAMYQAKNQGRNDFYFFTEQINENAIRQLRQENELRSALKDNQFFLVYQPVVDIKTGKAVSMEALVRWQHPERGIVMPGDFIPIMENNRMIVELGEQVIEMVCRDLMDFHAYNPLISVAINLSPRQLKDESLIDVLKANIYRSGISSNAIKLEITESVLMEDIEESIDLLGRLKDLGVTLSIDDFGTGYSSLNYLKKLPVDELKVDREFIKDIPMDGNDMEITAAVIAMAHKLKLTVVAEGIEEVTQVAFLLQNHCDYGQGYYYHRPQPKEVVKKLLSQEGVFLDSPRYDNFAAR